MRLIKMSKELTPSHAEVVAYFEDPDSEFRTRHDAFGIFMFTKGRISPDGISSGETLLFSYEGEIVYVAKAASGPLPTTGPESAEFPYYLQVDLPSLKRASIPLADLQNAITAKTGESIHLLGQGWTRLPDDEAVEDVINSLVTSSTDITFRYDQLESRVKDIVEKECSSHRISVRTSAEKEAASIISSHLGTLTSDQLAQVLKLADKDYHNDKEKAGRFGLTFLGANSAKICSNIDIANDVIRQLWEKPEAEIFSSIDQFLKSKPLTGAGIGFYSLIPYLRNPQKFNIWIDVMIWAVEAIEKNPFKKRSGKDYREYDAAVNAFRDHFKLEPQALDIVLTVLYKDSIQKIQFWWVNQGASYEAESEGGYIFAPLHTDKGASLGHWNNLAKVKKGDVIFHYVEQAVRAVSTVTEEAVEVKRPAGSIDGKLGRLVKCSYTPLSAPVSLSSIPLEQRIKEGGPFNKNGGVKQVYLFPVSERFAEVITPLVGVNLIEKLKSGQQEHEGGTGWDMKKVAKAENKILYGPPGTGKTHFLRQEMERYITTVSEEPEEAYLARLVADKPWWQIVGAAVLDKGKIKVPKLLDHPLVQAKLAQTNIQSPNVRLWATLQSHTIQDCPNVNYQKKLEPQFFWKDADSSWSVKEELLQELAPEIVELKKSSENIPATETIKRYEFITFHQSYGYEDFVEGIRPVMEDTGEGDVQYRVEPGIFKKICQRAEKDPSNEYAIFIDEINRGNISKIFGELITLIEPDKRVKPDGMGMRARLPYSKEEFGVPANLSIIGTMNTADRSIALIDIALRRRFRFREMMPDLDLIEEKIGTIDGVNVKSLLDKINRRIEFLYDRDHMIGHSYFLNCTTLEDLRDVFLQNIIPLLQEYFYGDWEKICLVLGCGTNGNGGATKNQHPLVNAEVLVEKEILGFDHLDFDDCCRYEVHPDFSKATGEKLKDYLSAIYQPHAKSADTQEG